MLEIARTRLCDDEGVAWREQTAAEIDGLPEDAFDSVVLSLCLSDMSTPERAFVLRESARRLAEGGRVVVADEVWAPAGLGRGLQRLWRIPQALLGWLLVGSVSHPIGDLAGELRAAGLRLQGQQSWLFGTLAMIVAEREA